MGDMDGKARYCNSVIKMAASKQVVKLKVNGVSMVGNKA